MSPLLLHALTAFFTALLAIAFLSRISTSLGLIDRPSARKSHEGNVPLIGGIAIFISLLLTIIMWGNAAEGSLLVNGTDALWIFITCGGFLVIVGALDDRFHLSVFTRISSEVLVALIVIEVLNLRVAHLGNLMGFGNIHLNAELAYIFTVLAISGIVNAFNMLDGLDGALASLVISTLAVFHLLTETQPELLSLTIGASLLAFLVSNLSLTKIIPKTFLGDAGSRLLGFVVVTMLLAAASEQVGGTKIIQPVTALFLVGLPLFDMVFTILRRVAHNRSPFAADRTHIHHLLLSCGLSDRRSLMIILVISISLNLIGLVLHRSSMAEQHQFSIFIVCFCLYSYLMNQVWLQISVFPKRGTELTQ